jgi:nicotinamidase/pyrazinamidase
VRTVVLDIDTQRDFMEPGGGLYVPGAETIVPAVRRILEAARDCGIPVVASLDSHSADAVRLLREEGCAPGRKGER